MENEQQQPRCHNTPMKHEFVGDGDDSDEIFTCEHCGCVKDLNGKVIPI